jgi:hypothetical protein
MKMPEDIKSGTDAVACRLSEIPTVEMRVEEFLK